MKSQIKTDFETWLIANVLKEAVTNKYYFLVGTAKVYIWFEGQTVTASDQYITLKIVPIDVTRIATGVKMHEGDYQFYIYAKTALMCDKIEDSLATLLEEKTIEQTALFRIELDMWKSFQRGNKFEGSLFYENVAKVGFRYWSC